MAGTSDHSEASDSIQPAELAADAPICLQVAERSFTTTKDTLTEENAFFASLMSSRWDNALDDGSYFIDADPALFEHILRYLRRGIFPLFFDIVKGHDQHLYHSLLEEARYFQIPGSRTGSSGSDIWTQCRWRIRPTSTRTTTLLGTTWKYPQA